jgi:predicted metallopeptidase
LHVKEETLTFGMAPFNVIELIKEKMEILSKAMWATYLAQELFLKSYWTTIGGCDDLTKKHGFMS